MKPDMALPVGTGMAIGRCCRKHYISSMKRGNIAAGFMIRRFFYAGGEDELADR